MEILFWLILIFIFLLVAVLFAFRFEKKKKEGFLDSFEMSLFLVMMPKQETKEQELMQKEEKALIAQMEQVFTNFLYINKKKKPLEEPLRIAFEIASQIGSTDISFYVAVPNFLETALEKYIHGVYSRALVEKIPQDYTIFEPAGATVGSY